MVSVGAVRVAAQVVGLPVLGVQVDTAVEVAEDLAAGVAAAAAGLAVAVAVVVEVGDANNSELEEQ